jgi:hypothetical protein
MQSGTSHSATSSTEGRIVVERPAPGLAQGKYAWPAWGIATLGALVVVLVLVTIVRNVTRKGRRT